MTIQLSDFGTAVNCIDGRVQQLVADWVKAHYHVRWVDAITEPGPDKVLAEGLAAAEAIRAKVTLSVRAHGSGVVAVCGHYDCAGNPTTDEEHLAQVRRCVEVVASWELPVHVVGLWVNDRWSVDLVCEQGMRDRRLFP